MRAALGMEVLQTIMKVVDLISALQSLPPDAQIRTTTEYGRYDVEKKDDIFLIYEKGDVIELHIDDGQASHNDLTPYRRSLFK